MKALDRIKKFFCYIFGADLMQTLMEENLHGNSAPLYAYLQSSHSVTSFH
ncbi:MAG: hypothetical protein PUE64_00795 [Firmicutes bacterium]|jgi:hypothetical protein|nr:hypothetical protein [Bacillota bacterium]